MYGTHCVLSMKNNESYLLQIGKPVTGNDFIGRKEELMRIQALLEQGQSVVLVAPRRFGKTSLLLEILKYFKKQSYFTTFIDIFSISSIKSLAAYITENVLINKQIGFVFSKFKNNIVELIKNVKFQQEIEGFEYTLSFGQKNVDE